MSFFSYAGACDEFLEELSSSLTKEDVAALRTNLRRAGWDSWQRWISSNQGHVSAYIAATPSQRSNRKAWRDPGLRSCLVLAAIQQVHRARAILSRLEDPRLLIGQRYRDMAAGAGEIYQEIFEEKIPTWPFGGENPFAPSS